MSRAARLLVAAAAAVALAGCAYKPLKAPCAPDEGGLTVAYSSLRPAGPGPMAGVGCGPLKPI